ncbi:MAG: PASTA domain-containing protein, partial [Actinobacteria bacterium]
GQAVPQGTTVAIVVSAGAQARNVQVPEVVGMAQADANNTLAALGLQVAVGHQSSSTLAADKVLAQTPVAGQAVAPGSTVAIVISTGPAAAGGTSVPSVAGLTLEQAQQRISSAGLTPVTVAAAGSGKPANTVTTQTPPAGAPVASGSSVVLFYASGQ